MFPRRSNKLPRNLIHDEGKIEQLFDDCSFAGINLVELCWSEISPDPICYYGFEVPKFNTKNTGDFSSDIDMNIKFVDEPIMFNPDGRERCWAYVADTKKNREVLVNSLGTGWYRIVDQDFRNEIIDMANRQGKDTTVRAKPTVGIKQSQREKEATNKLEELESKVKELTAALLKSNEVISDLSGNKNVTPQKVVESCKDSSEDGSSGKGSESVLSIGKSLHGKHVTKKPEKSK